MKNDDREACKTLVEKSLEKSRKDFSDIALFVYTSLINEKSKKRPTKPLRLIKSDLATDILPSMKRELVYNDGFYGLKEKKYDA